MAHDYPVHLSLEGRSILTVGAGAVARRRVARLLEAGARVQVVAPQADAEIEQWAGDGKLAWQPRAFQDDDLEGAQLVFVASNDAALNARVAEAARARGLWVNRADAPDDSDFAVPACVRGEHCLLSVTTHGHAPAASRRIARELSTWLRRGPERFAHVVAEVRQEWLAKLPRATAQARLRALAGGPLWKACQEDDEHAVRRAVDTATRGDPA